MAPTPPRLADDDPTLEEEAPDFESLAANGGREDLSIVASGGDSAGAIEHDERGEARWKWVTETAAALETEKTFDHLEALSNASLALADAPATATTAKPPRKTGYNPYDVGGPPPSKSRK